jgi:hypothetical protein
MFLAALLDLDHPRFRSPTSTSWRALLVPGEAVSTLDDAWRGNLSGSCSTCAPGKHAGAAPQLADVRACIDARAARAAVGARAAAVFRRIAERRGPRARLRADERSTSTRSARSTRDRRVRGMLALERLGVERVIARVPVTGTGTVRARTARCRCRPRRSRRSCAGARSIVSGGGGERLTPTGAALARGADERFEHAGPVRGRAHRLRRRHSAIRREGPPNRRARAARPAAGRARGATRPGRSRSTSTT